MTTIQIPEELGQSLRNARKHLGLTQPELALAAGVAFPRRAKARQANSPPGFSATGK